MRCACNSLTPDINSDVPPCFPDVIDSDGVARLYFTCICAVYHGVRRVRRERSTNAVYHVTSLVLIMYAVKHYVPIHGYVQCEINIIYDSVSVITYPDASDVWVQRVSSRLMIVYCVV